jgi:hypothetical protein
MLRKAAVALTVGAVLTFGCGTALALDCTNVSRAVPPQPASPALQIPSGPTVWVVQGDWWYINFGGGPFTGSVWDKVPPGTAASVLGLTPDQAAALGLPAGTINGNYQAGSGFGLLDNAQAPCNANRQTTNGIQAESTRCPSP